MIFPLVYYTVMLSPEVMAGVIAAGTAISNALTGG